MEGSSKLFRSLAVCKYIFKIIQIILPLKHYLTDPNTFINTEMDVMLPKAHPSRTGEQKTGRRD